MKTQGATTTGKEGKTSTKKDQGSKTQGKANARAATPKRTAKATKATKPPATKTTTRMDSKKAIVLELLRRKQGATLAVIAKATDWQNHSIRGFVSGTVARKMGLKVESTKGEAGERTYRIVK
jgi:hypothetical protein